MPQISRFSGIRILMFFGDHNPPHFHARHGSHHARIRLDGKLLDGHLPPSAHRLIRTWTALHQDDLRACWERAIRNELPGTIDPLPRKAAR